jgi:hypothetical protein
MGLLQLVFPGKVELGPGGPVLIGLSLSSSLPIVERILRFMGLRGYVDEASDMSPMQCILDSRQCNVLVPGFLCYSTGSDHHSVFLTERYRPDPVKSLSWGKMAHDCADRVSMRVSGQEGWHSCVK